MFLKSQEDQVYQQPVYSSFIQRCIKEGMVRNGEEAYSEMLEHDIEPNEVLYNQMINLYGKNGHLNTALKTYNDMLADKIQPNEIIMNSMISVCAKNRDMEKSAGIL
eukprot:UN28320